MKFSFRQILASAAGAVIAALIASSFGVTGTIVGVAIGSMAATLGTALVSQSIERGQKAVKQAAVRVPEGRPTASLLRRMGGTDAAGGASSSVEVGPKEPGPTEVAGTVGEETTEMASVPAPLDMQATEREPVRALEDDERAQEDSGARTPPTPPTAVRKGAGVAGVTGSAGVASAAGAQGEAGGRRFTWKAFAGTVAIVFVLALGFVTAVELIANRPTVFTPSSPRTPSTTTTTTATTTSNPSATSNSTSPTTSSTTTSTTAVSSTTTTTTSPSTTTSTVRSATTTTTTAGP